MDDKIDSNQKEGRTLEQIARAIFKSWFVDFDPVRAKTEGKKPVGMDSETAKVFPDSFMDSELGRIPKGWKIKRIGDVTTITKGQSYKSSELQPSTIALVTLKSINRGGGYKPDGLKPFVGRYKQEQVITPGEVVVANTDVTQAAEVIGKPAIVRPSHEHETLVASLDLSIIRPSYTKTISNEYLYCLFMMDDFQSHIYGYTNGTTVLHLAKDGIPSYILASPPEKLAESFKNIAGPIFKKIGDNEQQNNSLASIRDTLLPKLLSGEIRIKDAVKMMEKAI